MSPNPRIARPLLISAALIVLASTLVPLPQRGGESWRLCLICGERGAADAILNVLLFAPLGVALGLMALPRRRAILMGALASSLIELAQLLLPGRDASIADVLFNTVGVALGVVAANLIVKRHRSDAKLGFWRSAAASVAAVAVMGSTGYMLGPSFPRSVYYGQWTPNLGHLEWYRGQVLGASLGPMAIPPGELRDSDSVRALLLLGAPLRVSARAGPPPSGLASLLSIYDHLHRGIILLGPDRDDLVFLYRTRAASLRFDQPALRVPDALKGVGRGDALRVDVWRRNDGYCLSTARSSTCGLGFRVDSGWSVLLYAEWFPNWLESVLDFFWLALLGLPAGLWARGALDSALSGSLLIAGIWLVPLGTVLLPSGPLEFVAVGLGFAVGLAFRRWVDTGRGGAGWDES